MSITGDVRSHFPGISNVAYMDGASASPVPDVVREAALAALEDKAQGFRPDLWRPRAEACRTSVAAYLDVRPQDIAFLGNTTEAINLVASSIPWQKGDEVIINDLDFPSNIYPWRRLDRRGVRVRVARSDGARLPMAAVEECLTARTRLVAISHVFSSSGYRADIASLGRMLHDHGVLLCVDGIQALGLMKPDVAHVDFYAGATFKGLLGPFGLAILYVSPQAADRLDPAFIGYASVASGWPDLPHPVPWADGAQRLQFSHSNYPGLYALEASLEFLGHLGWDNIHTHVTSLGTRAIEMLSRLPGVTVVTPGPAGSRLGIVAFDVQDFSPDDVAQGLAQDGVIVGSRYGHVRASFHVYNVMEDVIRLGEALARHTSRPGPQGRA